VLQTGISSLDAALGGGLAKRCVTTAYSADAASLIRFTALLVRASIRTRMLPLLVSFGIILDRCILDLLPARFAEQLLFVNVADILEAVRVLEKTAEEGVQVVVLDSLRYTTPLSTDTHAPDVRWMLARIKRMVKRWAQVLVVLSHAVFPTGLVGLAPGYRVLITALSDNILHVFRDEARGRLVVEVERCSSKDLYPIRRVSLTQ